MVKIIQMLQGKSTASTITIAQLMQEEKQLEQDY
jgi:ABC-type arginine/histidine transport system permease subunit